MSQRVNHFNFYVIGEIVNETVTPDEPIERFEFGLSGAFFNKEYTTEKL